MYERDNSMVGKICLVTGATFGLGKVTTQALAAKGATVVAVARNKVKGEAVVSEIKQTTGNANVRLMLADLSSQQEIRKLAEQFQQEFQALHVLVNNAGVMNIQRTVTVDGYETTFAVNHLAYFLLTKLLMDRLKASAPARVVSVSSGVAMGSRINFDDLQAEKSYAGFSAYGQSKLANILFTVGLAKRLQGTGVTANTLHPGFVATGFATNNGSLARIAMRLGSVFALPPEKGAETQIYLATAPEVANISGKYFVKKQVANLPAIANDEVAVERLWRVSEELCHLTPVLQSA